MTYKLSMPNRVIAFFRADPAEELSADDIATKFDAQRKNVHTLLQLAVKSGQLMRKKDDEHGYLYSVGPAIMVPVATPEATTGTTKQPRQPKADIDLLTLPIDTDIPLPAKRVAQQHAAEALDRLTQPGHSFGVPLDASGLSALRKAITERHNAGTHRYVARATPTEFRVWRIA